VEVDNFHFLDDAFADPGSITIIRTRLKAFYDAIFGSAAGGRVSYINWPNAVVKVFNLSDPTPRVPYVQNLGYTAGSAGSTVPTETAAVISWHAAPVSGTRFQRLYNRCFIGGLPTSAINASGVALFPTFNAGFITACQTAASGLLAANDATLDWVQVSNAGGVTEVRPITGGWVDNSPDTQRRRSVKATSRNTWT
jgi:hypothetical protein